MSTVFIPLAGREKKIALFYVYIKEARTTKISNPGYKQTIDSRE
jgi:hypothetical protein